MKNKTLTAIREAAQTASPKTLLEAADLAHKLEGILRRAYYDRSTPEAAAHRLDTETPFGSRDIYVTAIMECKMCLRRWKVRWGLAPAFCAEPHPMTVEQCPGCILTHASRWTNKQFLFETNDETGIEWPTQADLEELQASARPTQSGGQGTRPGTHPGTTQRAVDMTSLMSAEDEF